MRSRENGSGTIGRRLLAEKDLALTAVRASVLVALVFVIVIRFRSLLLSFTFQLPLCGVSWSAGVVEHTPRRGRRGLQR